MYLPGTYFDSNSPSPWAGMARLSAADYKPPPAAPPSMVFDDHSVSSRSCWNIATASFSARSPSSPLQTTNRFPVTPAATFYGTESPLTSYMTSSLQGNPHPRPTSSDCASLMSAALYAAAAEVTFHFYARQQELL